MSAQMVPDPLATRFPFRLVDDEARRDYVFFRIAQSVTEIGRVGRGEARPSSRMDRRWPAALAAVRSGAPLEGER